ncbi:hypothetical protein XM38_033110 [Halomicronema hongdechloris C2206]|uniref:RNA polymerase sigma factor 70 region 4 type 2 domain-containing protein n=1 Tax=Halomicronema hongdechloris C2206 TaxID=1641165 RepID=A0A1Z3HPW7_9CYAN|nr:sigma factor-like helix-turn-helix DNA-binding protein [Halomicronema hongdechloris]ASC72354.1 hypothetical protein XM38_033110 [Halomicronema hongdechloris C2206]
MLTSDYLKHKAKQRDLTPEQTEVFRLKFGEQKSNQEIADRLGISVNACVQCLGEIYRKFAIEGRGRGKAKRLLSELIRDAEHLQAPGPDASRSDSSAPVATVSPGSLGLALPISTAESTPSERQQLQAWLDKLQTWTDVLDTDQGCDRADSILLEFTRQLPVFAKTLAIDSEYNKVQITQAILRQTKTLFLEFNPALKENRIEALAFLRRPTPLTRSVLAFVSRILTQLYPKRDISDTDVKHAIRRAIEIANEKASPSTYSYTAATSPSGSRTYSSWIRQICFQLLQQDLQRDRLRLTSTAPVSLIHEDCLTHHLMAVDTALLDLYLASCNTREAKEVNFNFFDIVLTRWMMAITWGRLAEFSEPKPSAAKAERSDDYHELDPREYEMAALSALRTEYHKLDEMTTYQELRNTFLKKVAPVADRYRSRFCTLPDQPQHNDYPTISIPATLCAADRSIAEDITSRVWRYCQLASLSHLEQQDIEELNGILDQAGQQPTLDFWLNEVDHFVAHLLEANDPQPVVITPDGVFEGSQTQLRLNRKSG